MTAITRTANPNGTYAYAVDGEPLMAASRVLYTHACTWRVWDAITSTTSYPVTMHKTEAAAGRASRPAPGWTKTSVTAVTEA